jgi:hypothetical protein
MRIKTYNEHMEKELKRAFYKAKYEENDLAKNVWQKIIIRNKRIARLKLWAFSFVGLASLAGFIPTLKELSSDLAQSGVYEYLSLAFSNSSSILSYWKELAFSIAESLPIVSIILSLSFVFVFFLSLKYVVKQIIKNQLYSAESLTLSF